MGIRVGSELEVIARVFISHFCLEKQRKDYADYRQEEETILPGPLKHRHNDLPSLL